MTRPNYANQILMNGCCFSFVCVCLLSPNCIVKPFSLAHQAIFSNKLTSMQSLLHSIYFSTLNIILLERGNPSQRTLCYLYKVMLSLCGDTERMGCFKIILPVL